MRGLDPRIHRSSKDWREDQCSDAVRIANDVVTSVAVADPVNRSLTSPICGSSEKLMVTAASGLAKWARIKVRSVSPRTVADIAVLALGARIMARIQISVPLKAAIRVDVATTPAWPCGPLEATVVILVTAIGLRGADAGRRPRGIGALAATIFARSTGELEAGA